MELTIKTQKELESLNDKNLLAYFKAERNRYYRFISSITCGCCGEFYHDLYKDSEHLGIQKGEWSDYLNQIKSILKTRSHVTK